MNDSSDAIEADIASIQRIGIVPAMLKLICDATGLGFAVVARVTEHTWTACAVHDDIGFGLGPGEQLPLDTTLCRESRLARAPVVIDHASRDPRYCDHHTPRIYAIESYISVPIVLPGGEYFGNLCAIDPKPAKVSDPRTVGMFTGFADLIAVQIAAERANHREHRALLVERAERELREQFIAILGHDLRAPLSGITAGAEYLQLPIAGLGDRALDVARRIGTSARRMAKLIDDVLDFARGRLGGGFDLRLADVHDVGAALREVAAEQQLTHPDRPLVIAIEAARPIRCDRARLQQLVANLLGNAFRHGAPRTPVHFSAKVEDGSIVVTVTNEGEPIPESSLPHLFTPFWHHATSTSRQGLGLGLFICDQIVKAHGGTIEVISSRQTGTTFAARLPISASAATTFGDAASVITASVPSLGTIAGEGPSRGREPGAPKTRRRPRVK